MDRCEPLHLVTSRIPSSFDLLLTIIHHRMKGAIADNLVSNDSPALFDAPESSFVRCTLRSIILSRENVRLTALLSLSNERHLRL